MTALTVAPSKQCLDALQVANDVRKRRAKLKRDLAAGHRSIRGVLLAPPWWAREMRVRDLLLGLWSIGPIRADQLLKKAGVGVGKRIGGLSPRQRRDLLELLAVISDRYLDEPEFDRPTRADFAGEDEPTRPCRRPSCSPEGCHSPRCWQDHYPEEDEDA